MGYSMCSCCGSTKLGVRLNGSSKLEPGEDSTPFKFHGVDWDPLDSIGVFGGLEASPEKTSKGAPGALERCVAMIRSKAEGCWGSELLGCPDARWDKGCESWLDKRMAISLSAFSCSCFCTCRICSAMNVASASTSALQSMSVLRYSNMAIERKRGIAELTYPVRSIISISSSDSEGATALGRPPKGTGVVRRDLLDSRPPSKWVDSKSRFRFLSDNEAGLTPSAAVNCLRGVSMTAGL